MERMEKQRPEWSRGDTLKSVRDLGQVALDELLMLITRPNEEPKKEN